MRAALTMVSVHFGDVLRPNVSVLAAAYALASCVAAAAIAAAHPAVFLEANAGLLTLWVASAAVALVCTGQQYVHRRFAECDFVAHNEVGGFIIAVAGAVYSVLLGFMTVIAWQHFSDARQMVSAESAAAADAWHTAVGMPQTERARVRGDVLRYASVMKQREWPEMRDGGYDKEADLIVMDAIQTTGGFNPANLMEADAQTSTMQQLSALHDLRYRRLTDNASGIAWFEWSVLLVGAACIIGFCGLFGVANKNIHLVMTSTVTIIIVVTLMLLFELQYPFRTDLRIGPDDWNNVIAHILAMQAGPQAGMR